MLGDDDDGRLLVGDWLGCPRPKEAAMACVGMPHDIPDEIDDHESDPGEIDGFGITAVEDLGDTEEDRHTASDKQHRTRVRNHPSLELGYQSRKPPVDVDRRNGDRKATRNIPESSPIHSRL